MPVVAPIVATLVELLLHVPPDVASISVVDPPQATDVTPVIGLTEGDVETVTIYVAVAVPHPPETV